MNITALKGIDDAGLRIPPDDARIGAWHAIRSQNRLVHGDRYIELQPKVMDLLLLLAAADGETVSRDALLNLVWPGVHVADDSLYRAISQLRSAFDKHADLSGIVETVPRRGYRLSQPEVPADSDVKLAVEDSARPRFRSIVPPLLILAAVLAIALVSYRTIWPNDPEYPFSSSTSIRPFTTLAGEERRAAISPDGKSVVFTWRGPSQDNWDLYLKPLEGDALQRLTTDSRADFNAAWSPDGTRLLYASLAKGSCRVMMLSLADPQNPDEIRECHAGSDTQFDWLSDGETVIFSDRIGATGPVVIQELRLSTGEVRAITTPASEHHEDFAPRASADEKSIAFVRSPVSGVMDLWVVDRDGGEPARITDDRVKVHGFDWLAGSSRLVFSSNRGGVFSLWTVSTEGEEPKPFLASGLRADAITFGMAGDVAIFEDERVTTEFVALDVARKTQQTVTSGSSWDWHPVFSPDGARIAFASDRSGYPELWVQSQEGEARRLTSFEGPFVQTPTWAPDGRSLVVAVPMDGNYDILRVPLDGSSPELLVDGEDAALNPSFSLDGNTLYFASDRTKSWQIWQLDLRSGVESQVTTSGGYRAVELDPGTLVFSRKKGSELFLLDVVAPDRPRSLSGSSLAPIDALNWAVANGTIHYVERSPEHVMLRKIGPGLDAEDVFDLGSLPPLSGVTVSPSSGQILFTQVRVVQSDLMILRDFVGS